MTKSETVNVANTIYGLILGKPKAFMFVAIKGASEDTVMCNDKAEADRLEQALACAGIKTARSKVVLNAVSIIF